MSNQQMTLNPGDTLLVTVPGVTPPPPPPTITSVAIAGPASVQEGTLAQYTDNVVGIGNLAVIWSCSDGAIDQLGRFTAPMKVEQVQITATSAQDPTKSANMTVSVATVQNTTIIQPSGRDDTAALLAAISAAASAKKILRLALNGSIPFQLGHIDVIASLLLDSGLVLSDIPGYASGTWMLGIGDGVTISAAGALLQMPNSFAASARDGSQYRHAIVIEHSNVNISGLSVVSAGGDGWYIRAATNVMLDKISGSKCTRNGMSITGQVKTVFVTNSVFTDQQNRAEAGIADGIDFEGNGPADFYQDCHIINCDCSRNQERGLEISCYFLDKTTPACDVEVRGCKADNCGVNGFQTHQAGKNGPVKITITQAGNTIGGQPAQFVQS